jgi:hypothetical protein
MTKRLKLKLRGRASVQRPARWGNQKVLDDAKRHTHTAQGLSVSTIGATCCGGTVAGRAAAWAGGCPGAH